MRLTPAEWELIRDHWPMVPAVAARYHRPGRDADEIESAVQWGLCRAACDWAADAGSARPGADVGAYLVARMHRAARAVAWYGAGWSVVTGSGHSSRGRLARRGPSPGWDTGIPREDDRFGRIDAADSFEHLCRLVAEPDRTVLRLVFLHDLGPAEVGRTLGWPASKVEYRLRAALIDLKRQLRKGA